MVTLAFIEVGSFILRFVGTCAVFYPFFLCRTIGAGDIKLMGTFWYRMERAARFAVETGMKGRLTEYPGYFEKESLLRLGPYLFAGYCLFLLIQ